MLGFLGTVGRFVQSRLGPQEDLHEVRVGAQNVAVFLTSRVAIGLSPQAGGFFSFRLQLGADHRRDGALNLATVQTDRRVLVFRAPTGTWAERRH